MAWNAKISLGNWVETIVYGEPIRTTKWTEVYANRKSVRQSEFYDAANVGLKPEVVYEVHSFEFDNHERVKVGTTEYEILRVYEHNDITELTLGRSVGSEV